jgi:hypothetical protein
VQSISWPEVLPFNPTWLVMLFHTVNVTQHCREQKTIAGMTLNHFMVLSTSARKDFKMPLQ